MFFEAECSKAQLRSLQRFEEQLRAKKEQANTENEPELSLALKRFHVIEQGIKISRLPLTHGHGTRGLKHLSDPFDTLDRFAAEDPIIPGYSIPMFLRNFRIDREVEVNFGADKDSMALIVKLLGDLPPDEQRQHVHEGVVSVLRDDRVQICVVAIVQ